MLNTYLLTKFNNLMRKMNLSSLHPNRWMKALSVKAIVLSFFAIFLLGAQDAFAQYKPADEVATIIQDQIEATKASMTATLNESSMNASMKYQYLKVLRAKLGETKNVATSVDAAYLDLTGRIQNNIARSTAAEAVHQEMVGLLSN